jgi:hypothetical protein
MGMTVPARSLAAIMALGLAFSPARAQWQAGVKVGFGQSGYSGSSEFNWDSGPASGAFVGYQLAPVLQLQIEADPVSKVGTSNVAGSMLTLTANYLAVPILLQLQLPTPSGVTPFVLAGSVMSVRLNCNLQFSGGGVQTTDSCEGSGRPKTTPVTFGVAAGAGLERAFGITTFLVEARVSSGLTVETLPLDATRPRSYGWSLLTGVSFPLGHATAVSRRPGVTPSIVAAPPGAHPANVAAATPLPELPSVAIATASAASPALSRDALDLVVSDRLVSVNAVDADVRSLLLLIAKEGGVSIVVDPDVSGRVWVTLTNVPVIDALRAVIQSAHLSVTSVSTGATQPAIVFYQLPVNVNDAPATTIAKRFGVSDDMARWIADNQKKTPR